MYDDEYEDGPQPTDNAKLIAAVAACVFIGFLVMMIVVLGTNQ